MLLTWNPRIRFDSEKVIHPGLTLYISSMIVVGLPLNQTQIHQKKTKKSASSFIYTSSGGVKVLLPDPIGIFSMQFYKENVTKLQAIDVISRSNVF